jgi:hypothetical protein
MMDQLSRSVEKTTPTLSKIVGLYQTLLRRHL